MIRDDYEQMLAAMKGLGVYPTLQMRAPGDWYVTLPSVEIGGDGLLCSAGESGTSPANAVAKTWLQIATLEPPRRLVIRAMQNSRREVRWNGFMWEDVEKLALVGPPEDGQ